MRWCTDTSKLINLRIMNIENVVLKIFLKIDFFNNTLAICHYHMTRAYNFNITQFPYNTTTFRFRFPEKDDLNKKIR